MPILLSGMAGVLEEAMRAGIDTSDMAKDLGRGLTDIAMQTPAKSVEAAMGIMRSFQGVKTGVSRGRMAGFENLMTAQAGRDVLMERLSDPNYRKQLVENKDISKAQAAALKMAGVGGKDFNYQNLQKTIGISGAQDLLQKTVAETGSPELLRRVFKNIQGDFGEGVEARQRFQQTAQSMGFSLTREQTKAMWEFAGKDTPKSEWTKKMQEAGIEDIKLGAKKVEMGEAGIGAQKMIQRQNLILDHGKALAEASFKMETALVDLADKSAKGASAALEGLGTVVNGLISGIDDLIKKIGAIQKGGLKELFF
jgi:hypothetical protein